MKPLSNRQTQILNFIKLEVQKKGYPPSVREIGEAVGLASSSTVHSHLAKIEEAGYIRRDPTKPRAIEILDDLDSESLIQEYSYVPVIGKVTAGIPITAVEHIEQYLPISKNLIKNDVAFILHVSGESMIEAGILDDDYAIVRQQPTVNNGEIAVVMTEDDEATIKRLYKENNGYRLQPENSSLAPTYVNNVTVLGKVIGIYREIR
ncbi:transcriptional repressor LexA [Desulfuribacillus alkaliarsenatis]|uniref:LexA repressor n=1 Tax=Desulfuribacillus alkaliarsenatis TaxID=766136 RepID=A0A1E5G0L4_9FIRM|nr:transcriptional repressor LexA [Desulfuribacillus alkaliarsenatis]OEF95998.1 repressor LexA [Desulfuribacillus alkaliarsenatis]